jgi:hypothetical protein
VHASNAAKPSDLGRACMKFPPQSDPLLAPLVRLYFQHHVPRQFLLAMTMLRQNALNCIKRSCADTAHASAFWKSHRTPRCLPAWQHPLSRPLSSTTALRKKLDFIQKQDQKQDSKQEPESDASSRELSQKAERKGPRKNAGKTSSLRRVAVEAQRSRGFVKGKGNKRFVDPDVETKVCISSYAATRIAY